ncbi:MAG: peptidylprolyl isomerase [Flammeovirgaceae bacterium]
MKTIRIAILLVVLTYSATFAQKSKETILLNIGNQAIPVSDFKYLYEKNYGNTDTAYNESSVREYLDLYIKFKLKVVEARSRKMHETDKFKGEFEKYRKQLAKPYLSDRTITEGLIKDAYERYKQEVRASHILVRVNNWGEPADTAKAYQKILDIRKRLVEGKEDFGTVAMEVSEDPSAKINKGDLGYFTSMQMVFEFEDVAYKQAVGSLSQPVKTQFGYHLIKTVDKIKARGSRKVSHIMVRYTKGMLPADSLEAIRKINEIAQKLKDGGNWDDLCKQFSDDRNSKDKGGALPWFSTGRMIPSFSEAAFNLKKSGDITEPILTPFGWHIIRLDSTKGIPPFDELAPNIKQRVSKDSRAKLSKTLFLKKLRKDNNFYEYTKLHEKLFSLFDTTLNEGKWDYSPTNKLLKKTLFKLNKDKFAVKAFLDYVKSKQLKQEGNPQQIAKNMYQQYLDETVMKYEEDHLESKYPEYSNLLREYREGILLFDIMDEEVWGKSIKDSTGLKTYFEENRDNYQWKQRAQASIFSVEDPALLPKLKEELKADTFLLTGIDLSSLVFTANDTLVDRPKRRIIDRIILSMKKNPNYLVKVEGFGVEGETTEVIEARLREVLKYFKGFRIEQTRVMLQNKGIKLGSVNAPAKAGGSILFTMYSTSPKALEKKYNKEDALALQVTEGWFEKGEEGALNEIDWAVGSQTIEHNGRKTYIIIHKMEEPRAKELKETKGMVISDYQNYLEAQWIEELKKKYPVKVMENELMKLIKK